MNTIEGNKLIAEFMTRSYQFDYDLKYNSSYDWLMPVVEKIRNDHFVEISCYGNFNKCVIVCEKPNKTIMIRENLKEVTTIQIVWLAVIQFIEWYNKEQSVKVSDTSKAK